MSSSSKLISHPHQPLWQHLHEVDGISASALRRKHVAEGFVAKGKVEQWRKLLVYFHDFGKATVYFQHRIIEAAKKENPALDNLDRDYIENFYQQHSHFEIKEDLENAPKLGSHSDLGAIAVQHGIGTEEVLMRAILLEIIKRHHGDLRNFGQDEFDLLPEKEEQLQRQWEKVNLEDYELILRAQGLDMPDGIEKLVHKYGGLRFYMVLSDALPAPSLQPYLLTLFLFSLLLAADKGDMMLGGSRETVGEMLLFPPNAVPVYKSAAFSGQEAKDIDSVREEAFQLVEQNVRLHPDAPFYSITLPTGLGKTLTAFNAAFTLQNLIAARLGYTPRIIYCLPFTSVIDQNAAILEQILGESGLPDGFMARHHYLSDWPGQKGNNNELSDSEKEYFTEGWEYPFTVTTFVQLLETLFSNKNRKLRKFHNLVNAIVILDEVQNIDAKYFETVEAMFQALYDSFNTRFVFVTATQPFLIKEREVIELTDPAKERTRRFFTDMDRIRLDVSLWKEGALPLEALQPRFQQGIEAAREKSCLFILNKVKASQDLFHWLREQNPDAELIYLSAAVLPVLRQQRIKAIKAHEKEGNGKQLIVVSTQVVEAGVDIDLDIVYRDLAPLDSINQSAGRCNRNGVKGLGEVRLFQMEKGYQKVYDEVLINATERVLDEMTARLGRLVIPEHSFYDLNQAYAEQIRSKIADKSAKSELIDWMKRLQFERVNDNFKVIEPGQYRHSVFIDYCDDATAIWSKYREKAKMPDRWERKKELRKLRPKLLQYVVQFPDYILPEEFKEGDAPIIYLGREAYPVCYDLTTGYKKAEEQPKHQAVQC